MLPLLPLAISLVPQLARWLGGPKAGDTAAAVAQTVQVATGTTDPVVARDAVKADPLLTARLSVQLAQIAAAREAETDQARQAELVAALGDVAGARGHDLGVRSSGGRNVRADVMLGAVTVGLLACIISAATGHLDQLAFGLVSSIAGVLAGCFKDAFGFEFGSSRQSEQKTAIIADLAGAKTPVEPRIGG